MNLFLRFKLLWLFGIFPPFLLFIFSLNLKLQQLICVLQMDQTLHSKAGLQLPTALSRAFDHLCWESTQHMITVLWAIKITTIQQILS